MTITGPQTTNSWKWLPVHKHSNITGTTTLSITLWLQRPFGLGSSAAAVPETNSKFEI